MLRDTRKEGKREPVGPAAYLSRGRSKHALWKSARGQYRTAICGTSPHWSDPIGWRGSDGHEEKANLAKFPWCGRCARLVIHIADLVAELPLNLRIGLPTHTCPTEPEER